MVEQSKKTGLIINVLIAISAVLAMTMEFFGHRTVYMVFKPLTTILVISLLFIIPQKQHTKFKSIMISALLFCLMGDILLLFSAYFVFGLAAFLVAHILFVIGFIQLKGFNGSWAAFIILYGIGTALFFWLRPGLGQFMIPVAAYVVVICFMAWQGIGLFLKEKRTEFLWIAIAVLLFMFSDTMIAISKFKSDFDYSSIIILGTYWLSIGLIANAARNIILKTDVREEKQSV
ncbi:lysoplasmalogenase [Muricauda sp. 334s03]|uniref:Lysoplasmalogenase n=1 Tax=Flagellimonas yonaguniensis TaxID=3031325 RepID=A0ABT5XUV9_9FLAO|nr:lysoplasmalogenase [[Muricauda] yonaguniensis]MDF0714965.1 lysoplasmalogenase [[Muricauda] yonaguniensis]